MQVGPNTGLHSPVVVVGAGVVVAFGPAPLVAWAWAGRIMVSTTGLLHLEVKAKAPAAAVPAARVFNVPFGEWEKIPRL